MRLDLGEDGLERRSLGAWLVSMMKHKPWAAYLDFLDVTLVLSVADGAVLLDDHTPATGTVAHVGRRLPAVVLREVGLGVGKHELFSYVSNRSSESFLAVHTKSSPLGTLLTLPQPARTYSSLLERKTTLSTPLDFNSSNL